MLYDAIIAGLGPAGATVSYELAKKGLNVLAFDKEKFPRYKVCGGCISLKAKQILPFDFDEIVEEKIYGAVFTYKSKRPVSIISKQVIGYNINREKFDNLLKEKAKGAGAVIKDGVRVTGAEECSEHVVIKTSDGFFKAKVLVAATARSFESERIMCFPTALASGFLERSDSLVTAIPSAPQAVTFSMHATTSVLCPDWEYAQTVLFLKFRG